LPQSERRLGSKRPLAFASRTQPTFGSVKTDKAHSATVCPNRIPVDYLDGARLDRFGTSKAEQRQ
jgi:hypothetical protein